MKTIFILLLSIVFCQSIQAQNNTISCIGDEEDLIGSVSYSIGQIEFALSPNSPLGSWKYSENAINVN
jgi:hypothetical protein